MRIPVQDGRNLARGTTAIYRCVQSGGNLMRESQQKSSEEKEEARDADPDVEAQLDFWNIMRDSMCRNHVASRTKLYVPNDDFPIPLNCIHVQRQTETGIDVLHEATLDDYWNVDGDK